jgi:ABC-type transport system involved in multi-copper enzyme maturation permease subunit
MTTAAATFGGPTRRAAAREFFAAVGTIMVKELRSRFRGRRAFVVITIYLGVLALIAYGGYAVISPSAREQAQFGGFGAVSNINASATIGTAIFILLSLFQLLLVSFIAPAFTAGAISLEREKQTLDLLVTTPMRPGAIVVGKLFSALAFVGLMILAAIPLSALVLMYGGATVDDIVRQQLVLLVTAVGFGSIGLFFSALIKRTQAATVLTYCTMLALTIGTALIFIFWTVMNTNASDNRFGVPRPAPEQILWVNPGLAMFDVIAATEVSGYGPFTSVVAYVQGETVGFGAVPVEEPEFRGPVQVDGAFSRPIGLDDVALAELAAEAGRKGDLVVVADARDCPPGFGCVVEGDGPLAAVAEPQSVVGHFWPRFGLTFAGLSLLLTFVSMRLVVPAGMRFVFRRRRTAAATTAGPAAGEPTVEETVE